jgi:glycosyltransferase involved in cell wall biosynthesis
LAKISVIYHHFPHYRAPVMRALALSSQNNYEFFGGMEDYHGIKVFKGDDLVKINPINFIKDERTGRIDFSGFEMGVTNDFDASIIIGNPNMIGAWRAARMARKNGLKTAFWTHGWLKKENWIKSKFRNFFYNRADLILTYGERAKQLGIESGFDGHRIVPIWNSLDWDAQSLLFEKYKNVDKAELRSRFDMPIDIPVILTISRVTDLCRYDWLVEAVSELRKKGVAAEVWMIGDGPSLSSLKLQADLLGVPLHSTGAIYDEEIIAQQIMAADVIASPGKVGLTAIHALAYGTPVVTHNALNLQMPEVEAISEGVSGVFFDFYAPGSLVTALSKALMSSKNTFEIRRLCRASLEGRFTPNDQVRIIDDAIKDLLNDE